MLLPFSRRLCALGTALALASSAHAQLVDPLAPSGNPSRFAQADATEPRSDIPAETASKDSPARGGPVPEVTGKAENGRESSAALAPSMDNSPDSSWNGSMTVPDTGTGPAPYISPDWAQRAAIPLHDATLRSAVREALAGTASPRKASGEAFRVERKDKITSTFDAARRPGCLQPGGLKHQWTGPFVGILALPFVVVAAVRGKCN